MNTTFGVSENSTDIFFKFNPSIFDICFILAAFVVLVAGLLGNLLVIYVVLANSHMRTVTNIFIVNLAIGDFLVILICLPPTVITDTLSHWIFGKLMCKIIIYTQYVSVSISILTLTSISYERYYAIVYPLKFQATKFRAKIIILIIWSLSILLCLPECIMLTMSNENGTKYCHPLDDKFQTIFEVLTFVVLYLIPITLIIYTYSQVVAVLWTVDKNIDFEEHESSVPKKPTNNLVATPGNKNLMPCGMANANYSNQYGGSSKNTVALKNKMKLQLIARRKAAKMLICVAVLFTLCNLPIHILSFSKLLSYKFEEFFYKYAHSFKIFSKMSHLIFYLNSCINPLIYYFMSDNFRKEFRKVLFCINKMNKSSASIALPTNQSIKTDTKTFRSSRIDRTADNGIKQSTKQPLITMGQKCELDECDLDENGQIATSSTKNI